ncbi:hypothetical protein HGM15179_014208 [Zosterops borbonicus]|uniref:Uncharacterized protein n=1 Tax=Zosterops borbonicus TaxID=364589 RepID=A0A8K1G7J3_9PASS|nr:hypothetical protein HGM15179_014208 [Zosterops borbonicus]
MSDEADRPEGQNAIQSDVDKLRMWAIGNLIKFYKGKYKVLLLGQTEATNQRTQRIIIRASMQKKGTGASTEYV